MIHYLANIVSQSVVLKNRAPRFNESGYNRVVFIANAIDQKISIVSMGPGEKKGFFKKTSETINAKIKIIYLPQWHITFFQKKLRHLFYSFFLFAYLIREVKPTDKIILYNGSKSFFIIMPVLVFKLFKKTKYILELEELYSYKRNSYHLKLSERLSIKYASAYIIVNSKMQKFINAEKPILINAGYYSIERESKPECKGKVDNNLQIVYTGRIDEVSGIDVFLESIQYITKKCTIKITGTGSKETDVRKFKNTNNLVEFKFLGIINQNDYHELLCHSHIAINPINTKTDFSEISFPSKILKYLSYGLLVVSSKIEVLHDMGQLNKYIVVYHDDSPQQLAEQINQFANVNSTKKEQIKRETKMYFDNSKKQLKIFVDRS